jgi:apolipoprotein N-acyltransferase
MANWTTFLWVIAGTLLFGFSARAGGTSIPVLAWIALIALVHGARSLSLGLAATSLWIAFYIAFCLTQRATMPFGGPIFYFVMAVEATVLTVALILERIAAPALNGIVATLAFPLALTAVEFLRSRFVPGATWGSLSYSQYGWLPLMQVAAVTGIWGITFTLGWFASTFEFAWAHGFQWTEVRGPVLSCAITLAAIVAVGQARIFFAPTERATIRVATLNRPDDLFQAGEMTRISGGRVSPDERSQVQAKLSRLGDAFLQGAEREARAGARLIVWPEQNLLVLKEDEPAFLERAKRLARDQHIYLAMGMGTIYLGDPLPFENKLVLIDASGEIVATHLKTRPVTGWEASVMKRGTENIPIVATEYGRMAGAICFEADFPELIRQVGVGGADLLIVPANEWKAIKKIHFQMHAFRAIEVGAPLLRAAASGVSVAIDPWGRVLSTSDSFAPGDHTMVAQLPLGGSPTLYARLGDVFAWLCVAGIVLMLIIRVVAWIR